MPQGYCIVTGASGGVGRAISKSLTKSGYGVLGMDKEPTTFLQSAYSHKIVDFNDPGSIAQCLSELPGPIGAVVHCAAEQPIGSAGSNSDLANWQKALQVNLLSLEQIISEVRESLSLTPPHRVIAISSVHATVSSKLMAPYSVSKAALNGWVRSAAIDLSRNGISTIAISAGAIDSPKLQEGLSRFENPEAARKSLEQRIPIQRIIDPHELADLVLYLFKPSAEHFTGSSLTFDGGITSLLASE